jgi:hypothetical protein
VKDRKGTGNSFDFKGVDALCERLVVDDYTIFQREKRHGDRGTADHGDAYFVRHEAIRSHGIPQIDL